MAATTLLFQISVSALGDEKDFRTTLTPQDFQAEEATRTEFIMTRARHHGNHSEEAALSYLSREMERLGEKNFDNHLNAPAPTCIVRHDDYVCPPSFREWVLNRAQMAAAFEYRSTHGSSGAETLTTVLSAIPKYGMALSTVRSLYQDFEKLAMNDLIHPRSQSLGIAEFSEDLRRLQLTNLLLAGRRSPRIASLINDVTDYVGGKPVMQTTTKELEAEYPSMSVSRNLDTLKANVAKLKEEFSRFNEREKVRDEFLKKLGKLNPEAIGSMSAKEFSDWADQFLTIKEKKMWDRMLAEANGSKAQQRNQSHGASSSSKENEGSPDPSTGSWTEIEREQFKAKMGMIRDLARSVELLAGDNKDLKATAMAVQAGANIAIILTSGASTGPQGAAIALVVVAFMLATNDLYADKPPPIEHQIFDEIKKLQRQVGGLANKLENLHDRAGNDYKKYAQALTEHLNRLEQMHQLAQNDARLANMNVLEKMDEINKTIASDVIQDHLLQGDYQNSYATARTQSDKVDNETFRLTKDHPSFLGDTMDKNKVSEYVLSPLEFRNATEQVHNIFEKGKDRRGMIYKKWAFGKERGELVLMKNVVADLKKNVALDISPLPFSGQNLRKNAIRIDEPFQYDVLSPDFYAMAAHALYHIYEPKDYASPVARQVLNEYQCRNDPMLNRIKQYLDYGVRQRAAFHAAIPENPEGGFNLTYLIRTFVLYEEALRDAVTEVARGDGRSEKFKGTAGGEYDDGTPLKQQTFKWALASQEGFLFPTDSSAIPYCATAVPPKDKDGNKLRTPPLERRSQILAGYANLIPEDILKARDILGGSFGWCYEDVGIDDERVRLEGSPTKLVGTHLGKLAFTLRIKYKAPGFSEFDVGRIRVTDKSERKFFKKEYAENWGGTNYNVLYGAKALDLEKLEKSGYVDALKGHAKEDREKHMSGGIFPTLNNRPYSIEDDLIWDDRFQVLKGVWDGDDSHRMEKTLVRDVGQDKDHFQITPSWESEAPSEVWRLDRKSVSRIEIENMSKEIITKLAENQTMDIRRARLEKTEQELRRRVGPAMDSLNAVDKARERIFQILWLAFGDTMFTNTELSARIRDLTGGSDLYFAAVSNVADFAKADTQADIVKEAERRNRALISLLLEPSAPKNLKRAHPAMDRSIQLLVELYWKRFLANQTCVASREALPESLKPFVDTEEKFREILKLGVRMNFGASTDSLKVFEAVNRDRPKLDDYAKPVAPKKKIDEPFAADWSRFRRRLAKESKLSISEMNEIENLLKDTLGNKLTASIIDDRGQKAAEAMNELRSRHKMTLPEAIAFLKEYGQGDLPAHDELETRRTILRQKDENPGMPKSMRQQMELALSNRKDPSPVRQEMLHRIQSSIEQSHVGKDVLLAKVREEIRKWKANRDEIENVLIPSFDTKVQQAFDRSGGRDHPEFHQLKNFRDILKNEMKTAAHARVAMLENILSKMEDSKIQFEDVEYEKGKPPLPGLYSLLKEAQKISGGRDLEVGKLPPVQGDNQSPGTWDIIPEQDRTVISVQYNAKMPDLKVKWAIFTFKTASSVSDFNSQLKQASWITDDLAARVHVVAEIVENAKKREREWRARARIGSSNLKSGIE